MKILVSVIAIAALAGCAASTPQDARRLGAERQVVFHLGDDYQTVYRRLVDVERRCFQTNLITASQIVNADLYPDTRSAEISVGMYGIATAIYQVIDLQGTDAGTTVTATFPLGNPQAWGDKVKGWAEGSRQAC